MGIRWILAILIFLTVSSAQAVIKLNVTMTCKKGIDKALVLVNELHAAEDVPEGAEMSMEMKNGPKLYLNAIFLQNETDYGPSATVQIFGQLYNQAEKLIKNFSHSDLVMNLGATKTVTIEDEGQRIEVSISPEVH